MARKKSTIKQHKLIVDEWFSNGFKGGLAYQHYHPDNEDLSSCSACFNAVVSDPEIQDYINERYEKAAKKLDVSIDGILYQLKLWLSYDITDTILLSPEEIKDLPVALRRLITKYKITESKHYNKKGILYKENRFIEVEFISKERAMEMVNRHIGFYEADNRQRNNIDLGSLSNEELLLRVENIKKLPKPDNELPRV